MSTGTRPYGDCWSTLCCLAVWSIWVESSTALGGFRVLKKTSEAPYTTKLNYRDRTSRGSTRGSPPPQHRIKPDDTLSFCSWIEVAGCFKPPIGYIISAWFFFVLNCIPPRTSEVPGSVALATMVVKHEVLGVS